MFPPAPTRVRWVLAFMDLPMETWFRRWTLGWLKPGFRHVRAYRACPGGLLVVQQTVARLQVEVLTTEDETTYTAWLIAEHSARIVVAEEHVVEDRWNLRGMSCVSVARSLLGWRALPWQWWWTPAGLHRRLVGAERE